MYEQQQPFGTAHNCPECGHVLISRAIIGTHEPRAGDFTLCGHCGATLRLDLMLKARALTAADQADIDANPGFRPIIERYSLMVKQRNAHRAAARN